MKNRAAATAAITLTALLALAGCASTTSSGGMDNMPGMGSSASASPAADVNNADMQFTMMMIPHHEQAVEMADMILAKDGIDERVLTLAEQIKAAQGPEIELMESWLDEWGTPMGDMDGMDHGGMMSDTDMQALEDATGAEASRLFLEQMIVHHRGCDRDGPRRGRQRAEPRCDHPCREHHRLADHRDRHHGGHPRDPLTGRGRPHPTAGPLSPENATMSTHTRTLAAVSLAATLTLTATACTASPDSDASPALIPHVHDVAFDLDGALLVGAHTGVYRVDLTTDEVSLVGKTTFDAMGLTVQGDTILASGHPDPANQDHTFTAPNVGLVRYSEAGWEQVSLAGVTDFHMLAATPAAPDFLLGLPSDRAVLAESTDAGQTWADLVPLTARDISIDTTQADIVTATTPDGLMVSRDGGTTFSPVAERPRAAGHHGRSDGGGRDHRRRYRRHHLDRGDNARRGVEDCRARHRHRVRDRRQLGGDRRDRRRGRSPHHIRRREHLASRHQNRAHLMSTPHRLHGAGEQK